MALPCAPLPCTLPPTPSLLTPHPHPPPPLQAEVHKLQQGLAHQQALLDNATAGSSQLLEEVHELRARLAAVEAQAGQQAGDLQAARAKVEELGVSGCCAQSLR